MYTNCDVLTNKYDELMATIKVNNPHIIMLTEIKPKNSRFCVKSSEFKIHGYNLFTNNLQIKTTRGIAIYIKTDLEVWEYDIKIKYNEALWLKIKTNRSDYLLLGCVYRSPNSNKKSDEILLKLFNEIANLQITNILITGDFNLPGINWSSNTVNGYDHICYKKRFVDCIRDCFMEQMLDHCTRSRGNSVNILDLILTRTPEKIQMIEYMNPLGKSDHVLIKFDFVMKFEKIDRMKTKYLYHKANYEMMKKDFRETDWFRLFADKTIQSQWDIFVDVYRKIVYTYLPTIKYNMLKHTKHNIPLNLETVKKIKSKHTAWKKYMRTREQKHYLKYCRLRNKVTSLIKYARKQYESSINNNLKDNPKLFWSYIKSKTHDVHQIKQLYSNPTDITSELVYDDAEKAEVLNNYFSSVFIKEPHFNHDSNCDSLPTTDNVHISIDETRNYLKKINPNKSCGPDDIHPRILSECYSELSLPFCLMFMKSMEECNIPSQWKEAKVVAIYKKGDKKEAGNYRPVSLTSVPCKLLEKFIRNHLMDYMVENNLISSKQFGFVEKRSTNLQLLNVLKDWCDCLENKNSIDCIYLDFRKAFDTVPHERLLHKLQKYNINKDLIIWIKNFLSGRRQRVEINRKLSEWKPVLSGIPQGSVLGPFLFLLYINDLPDSVKSNIYLFADDTKIFREIKDNADQVLLQEDLDVVMKWSKLWLLDFNTDKCVYMQIGNQKLVNDYYLSFDEKKNSLKLVDEVKDLGILFDNELKFENHISGKINKANSIIGIIRRSYRYLNITNFIPLYKAMVRSYFDYASSITCPIKKEYIKSIEDVQRRATKLVPEIKHLSYEKRLMELNLPTLVYRRLRGDMIELYKITHNIYNIDTSKLINYRKDSNTRIGLRGHDYVIDIIYIENKHKKRFLPNRVAKVWNTLPMWVVNSDCLNKFKNNLDKLWKKQEIVYDFTRDIDTSIYAFHI